MFSAASAVATDCALTSIEARQSWALFLRRRRWRYRRGEIGFRWPWAARYLAGVSATTLVATFATMPFAAFHFHQIALMSLLANLVAVPLFAFVLMLNNGSHFAGHW